MVERFPLQKLIFSIGSGEGFVTRHSRPSSPTAAASSAVSSGLYSGHITVKTAYFQAIGTSLKAQMLVGAQDEAPRHDFGYLHSCFFVP